MLKRIVVGSAIAAPRLAPDPPAGAPRGRTIDAPPEAVWPWLVQMGYGRGGWYSYDAVDMKGASSATILPEHQSLAVGDLVPTDPGGGFVVKVVESEHALVLYVDPEVLAARHAPTQPPP